MSKTTITLSVDADVKEQAMDIVQNKMNTTLSGFVNTKFIQLVNRYSNKSKQEVKKWQT